MANRKLKGITYKGKKYFPVTADDRWLRDYGDMAIQPPSRTERVYLPGEQKSLPSSSYDIHVRISKEDLGLLEKMPESDDGLIAEFLERAHKKVLDTGHAECLAAEAEVDAVVNALQNFIHSDQAQLKDKAHASDMASYWKRNYVIKDTGAEPLKSREQPKLPPSSNVRMFSYRGANTVMYKGKKYVRVADERETPEYVKPGKGPEDIRDVYLDEAFSALLAKRYPSIRANSPLPQMKTNIDKASEMVGAIKKASNALNERPPVAYGPPTARWLTDAFFDTDESKKILDRLIEDPETVRQALNWYVDNVNDLAAASETLYKVSQDMLKGIVEQGWTSKYKLRKERKEQKKQILREFFGLNDSEVASFLNEAYSTSKQNLEKARGDKSEREPGRG